MQQWQTSYLDNIQLASDDDDPDADCGELNNDHKLWCFCWGCDDGHLMICCDRQGERCLVW